MSTSTKSGPSAVSLLREDAATAVEHAVFSNLLGSVFLPRFVRRLLLRAGGAHVLSGPGHGFSVTGGAHNLTIGRGVFINKSVSIESVAPVTIGDGSALGMRVSIMTSHHDIDSAGRWDPVASGRPVVIGERVWIGGGSMILPGAHIEDDVIVAAGAVVRGRLESHGVYAGVPARRIRDYTGEVDAQA
ncbi:acyltransferase [Microbacterium sp. M1A1_1b]|uniref:acyltransferase n=1 Tax=Curtobacterium sp. VKM Ac-2922 TaxID=2929475 RepID=UPI001FB44B78|nr:DapH/DapD/GlmU-related protein [Curtobacterium sp. VKM Ac-2922]MCJ1713751.1 hypothetical protein [Curtobacterium sp. VKM Ac-2922]